MTEAEVERVEREVERERVAVRLCQDAILYVKEQFRSPTEQAAALRCLAELLPGVAQELQR